MRLFLKNSLKRFFGHFLGDFGLVAHAGRYNFRQAFRKVPENSRLVRILQGSYGFLQNVIEMSWSTGTLVHILEGTR